jgi:hypothetical protein
LFVDLVRTFENVNDNKQNMFNDVSKKENLRISFLFSKNQNLYEIFSIMIVYLFDFVDRPLNDFHCLLCVREKLPKLLIILELQYH